MAMLMILLNSPWLKKTVPVVLVKSLVVAEWETVTQRTDAPPEPSCRNTVSDAALPSSTDTTDGSTKLNFTLIVLPFDMNTDYAAISQ